MSLLTSFFVAMALGILWGGLEAWDKRAGYVVLIIAAFWIIGSYALSTPLIDPSGTDWAELLAIVLGFMLGSEGSKTSYRQAFEEDND